MSFGRLLAAGKSWAGGDGVGRYRMKKHIRLPKFISPRNPFQPETAEAMALSPGGPAATTGSGMQTVTASRSVSRWARVGAGLHRWAAFCLDHNPFSQIGRSKLPSIPRFGRPAIQGELSLEKVQVVRNDLAQTDLEVIPGGPGGTPLVSPAWKNLAARMYGTGNK